MRNLTVGLSLLTLALAGCGSGGNEPDRNAVAAATTDAAMAMSGPFAEAETRMNEAMPAAIIGLIGAAIVIVAQVQRGVLGALASEKVTRHCSFRTACSG